MPQSVGDTAGRWGKGQTFQLMILGQLSIYGEKKLNSYFNHTPVNDLTVEKFLKISFIELSLCFQDKEDISQIRGDTKAQIIKNKVLPH